LRLLMFIGQATIFYDGCAYLTRSSRPKNDLVWSADRRFIPILAKVIKSLKK
jgi:hypothetical protein